MRINHNITALNTYGKLNSANNAQAKSMEKLSSGLRINSAADDAAGLAISEKMRGQIRGLDQAGKNAQDSISMIQTAEGALGETTNILQRMRELAVQAGNDSNTESDRGEIQKEMNQLTSEVNRIGNTTEFNSQKLLNGTGGTVKAGTTTPAAEAKVTGTAVTLPQDFSATNLEFTVDIGSTSKTVTLNKNYDGTTNDMDTLASDLGTALGSDVTVANNNGKLEITAANTTDSIKINAATTGNLSDIGLSAGTTAPTAAATTGAKSEFTSQIGANANQTMTLEFSDMRAAALGIVGTDDNFTKDKTVNDGANGTANENALDVSTAAKAGNAVTVLQNAIDKVSGERSKLGAYQNRLDHTINNLSTSSENLTAAESRIRDVDMAREMMEQTKNSILSQASQAMLGQANQQPQNVLQLLR
ncbi:flagellin N-terminal helical domain-containing protein [Priestia megaterium]|uniref:flagellin N-terminal helical domain-containing protein n=1 Tax=Priestia megaterium TaxID=1404 RepID=UPI002363522E|nr:flagellin [Priestia megaterium]MDD1512891.1 flagellin [Priestia megaterium]